MIYSVSFVPKMYRPRSSRHFRFDSLSIIPFIIVSSTLPLQLRALREKEASHLLPVVPIPLSNYACYLSQLFQNTLADSNKFIRITLSYCRCFVNKKIPVLNSQIEEFPVI